MSQLYLVEFKHLCLNPYWLMFIKVGCFKPTAAWISGHVLGPASNGAVVWLFMSLKNCGLLMYMDFQERVTLRGFDVAEALGFVLFSPMLPGLSMELSYKWSDKWHSCEQHPFHQGAALASHTALASPAVYCSQFHGYYSHLSTTIIFPTWLTAFYLCSFLNQFTFHPFY